jgi:gliding motility-associated-like protein
MRCCLFIVLFVASLSVKATHIVGGEFRYEFLGANTYRITFDLYRDCVSGDPKAIDGDGVGSFGIYNLNSGTWLDRFKASSSNVFIVPPGFNNSCINNPPNVCLSRLRFTFDKVIPTGINNYLIVYQRCCRNQANNISNFGGNQVGATYYTTLNTQFGSNNSAVAKSFPPQIICINNPLFYDAGYTDPDGDSLSYSFCSAKNYNDDNIPNPEPADIQSPPYSDIPYAFGFTSNNPITSSPTISIDQKTGLITGTPSVKGRFVVTVCCNEYRNGNLIGLNRRDFQFETTNCSKTVVANTPLFSDEANTYSVNCANFKIDFKNTSTGGFTYEWDFGVPGITTDVSTLKEPSYTYPDTGTYQVKLYVNRGSTCPDSILRLVKVYPTFNADFDFSGILCPNELITFTDKSTSTSKLPSFWNWNFDDGTTSLLQNPTHSFAGKNGGYNVSLTATNTLGCASTKTKNVNVIPINFTAGFDTIVLKQTPVQLNAGAAATFTWTPSTYMNNANSGSPILIFPDTGRFVYNVKATTANGCPASDDILIYVVNDFTLLIPTAFSPNGDKLNDLLSIIQAGYGELLSFRIYDRWGKALFYTTNFRTSWDGTFNGKPCDNGTYFWRASAKNIFGQERTIQGDVFLTR